jgi:hypothetical protein
MFGPLHQSSPISPAATSLPSSPTTRIAVFIAGSPAEPALMTAISGEIDVTSGLVSVIPKAWTSGQPTFSHICSSGKAAGAPPIAVVTMREKSVFLNLSC